MKNGLRASRGYGVAWCALATTALATAILYWLGFSLLAALAAALLLSCPVALLYAWWLSHRAVKTVERAAPGMTTEAKSPRRQS